MGIKELNKLKDDLYVVSATQKKQAWYQKDYETSMKIRQKEKENYEKWRLIKGIIKANEKEKKENE